MSNKKIAIYTLTSQRDEFIDNMLAEELRKYGHEVIIRSYINAARESICYEKPDVIIHPMVGGEYKMDTVQKCKEWGIEVIVRRGEAGMGHWEFKDLDENRKKLHLGNWDYSPYVDLELVWGTEFGLILCNNGHMPMGKVRPCGAFAFDPYFKPDCKKNDDINRKKTILFATGFSTADCNPEYCETGLPEGSSYHHELQKLHSEARQSWLYAIGQLVKWFGEDWAFELKVRPGEQATEYTDKVPSCVKIHPQDAPSSEVLKNVDILVHSGSTLAIEAHLLDIPSINFCNVNPDPLLSKVSPTATSYNELEFLLTRATPGRSNINDDVFCQLQDHLYGRIDGKACYRAAKYIIQHIAQLPEWLEKRGKDGSKVKRQTSIPDTWPKEAKYLTEGSGIHLERKEGTTQWSCPCCRNIFWGNELGIHNCPYCNMKIERTLAGPGEKTPTRKRMVTQSALK